MNIVEMKNAKPLPAQQDIDVEDRKRRLIVEFAIENVSVVKRRADKETKAKTRASDEKEKKKIKEVETKTQERRKKRDRETTAEEDEISKMGRIISQKRQKKRMAKKR